MRKKIKYCIPVVEKGIVLPKRRSGGGRAALALPFEKLEKGQSFVMPYSARFMVGQQMGKRHKENNKIRYTTRTSEDKTSIRVWRIK